MSIGDNQVLEPALGEIRELNSEATTFQSLNDARQKLKNDNSQNEDSSLKSKSGNNRPKFDTKKLDFLNKFLDIQPALRQIYSEEMKTQHILPCIGSSSGAIDQGYTQFEQQKCKISSWLSLSNFFDQKWTMPPLSLNQVENFLSYEIDPEKILSRHKVNSNDLEDYYKLSEENEQFLENFQYNSADQSNFYESDTAAENYYREMIKKRRIQVLKTGRIKNKLDEPYQPVLREINDFRSHQRTFDNHFNKKTENYNDSHEKWATSNGHKSEIQNKEISGDENVPKSSFYFDAPHIPGFKAILVPNKRRKISKDENNSYRMEYVFENQEGGGYTTESEEFRDETMENQIGDVSLTTTSEIRPGVTQCLNVSQTKDFPEKKDSEDFMYGNGIREGVTENLDPQYIKIRLSLWTSEIQKKYKFLVTREIPKYSRIHNNNLMVIRENCKKIARAVLESVKEKIKWTKQEILSTNARAKMLNKRISLYIKQHEKEWKKRIDLNADQQKRVLEEINEKERQQRKLDFLLTQTELYAHFMSKKLNMQELEGGINIKGQRESQNPAMNTGENENGESAFTNSKIVFNRNAACSKSSNVKFDDNLRSINSNNNSKLHVNDARHQQNMIDASYRSDDNREQSISKSNDLDSITHDSSKAGVQDSQFDKRFEKSKLQNSTCADSNTYINNRMNHNNNKRKYISNSTVLNSNPTSGAPKGSDILDVPIDNYESARREALRAYEEQKQKTRIFDNETWNLRQTSGSTINHRSGGVVLGSSNSEIPFSNSRSTPLSRLPSTGFVEQPRGLTGHLKPYQLKGLNWLINLHEQGINGILADEMGLGKTVQTISLLVYLAEQYGIWGPFIVVAPTSTLPNWAAEITKFYPKFRVLPYWGNVKQRSVLRKLLHPRYLHREDSVVHVVVTSYHLVVQDEKYFHRIHWEYMILDEAHAIKNSASLRWNTLLSFENTRNRLLLTGTPIQNNMAELWALLHFIMPTLFDSHNEFYEWFSKDIEDHAQGAKNGLNKHQLNRLHMILKPFMLRRVKKEVENELPPKYEKEIKFYMTPRQLQLYDGIKNKLSIGELFNKINTSGMSKVAQERNSRHLFNLVMQFRNVCNHPEILQRSQTVSPLQFTQPQVSVSSYNNIIAPAYKNFIGFSLPKLIYKEGLENLSQRFTGNEKVGIFEKWTQNLFSIFSQEYVTRCLFGGSYRIYLRSKEKNIYNHASVQCSTETISNTKNPEKNSNYLDIPQSVSSTFSSISLSDETQRSHCWDFSRFINLSPSEIEFFHKSNFFVRWQFYRNTLEEALRKFDILGNKFIKYHLSNDQVVDRISRDNSRSSHFSNRILLISTVVSFENVNTSHVLSQCIKSWDRRFRNSQKSIQSCSSASNPVVWAPPIEMNCSNSRFKLQMESNSNHSYICRHLLGHHKSVNTAEDFLLIPSSVKLYEPSVAMFKPYIDILSPSRIRTPQFSDLVRDCAKLKVLDKLLKQLKQEKHRVLVYSQFTEVLYLLEDFLYVRGYKFVRLDGSSKLDERRDVVDQFQNDPSIFIFLLSTRAGGLGINLTAADTVVFYDNDWNPTSDAQAMDRAHRIGQTKPVTVYRLITRNSVEEHMLNRAKQKGTIQNLVIQGGHLQLSEEDLKASDMLDILSEENSSTPETAALKRRNINPIKMIKTRSSKPKNSNDSQIQSPKTIKVL